MKVGILTFQFAHNYGALLQAYGLYSYLQDKGYAAEVINYIPAKVKKEYSMNPLVYTKSLKGIISLAIRNFKRRKQNRLFCSFQGDILRCGYPLYTSKELQEKQTEFDCIFVGSDQVWNVELTGLIKEYFLDFQIPGIRKIAYAGSFGTEDINTFQQEQVKTYFKDYSALSVREKNGKEIIKRYANIDSTVVCDPVFLLTKEQWKTFARKPDSVDNNQKFILYYTLKQNDSLAISAEKYAKENGWKVYSIHPTAVKQKISGKQLYDVGPKEFVWLIMNSERVVSNSFHATAFSIIFEKQLMYQEVNGLGSRVTSLFEQLDIRNSSEEDFYDLSFVDKVALCDLKRTGIEFIDRALQ